MNVEKMRRQQQRTLEVAEQTARTAWLASLTPSHRAKHATPWGGLGCDECRAASVRSFAESFARAVDNIPKAGR